MHNTSHEFGFVDITNRRSLKVISEISPPRPASSSTRVQLENRRRILRWLANFVVLCQNDVICEFHSPKTMELILVVFISAGMAGNSQNGVSRSLNLLPFAFNNQHHHYATRTSYNIYIPRVNHVFSKRNIRFSAVFTYNTTPDCIIIKLYTHSL